MNNFKIVCEKCHSNECVIAEADPAYSIEDGEYCLLIIECPKCGAKEEFKV